MELLPPGWQDIGAQGLVVLFVLAILLGWLIPKRWVDKQLADKDRQLSEKDAQIAVKDEAIERLTTAVQDLTVTAHTGQLALRGIHQEAQKKAGDE